MERESIVVLSFDTLGDLILRQPLLTALLDEGHPVTVVVRRTYERILPLLDPRLEAITTEINPYARANPQVLEEAKKLRRRIASLRPEILLSAPFDRTYLDDWLASRFRKLDRTGFFNPALAESPRDPFLATSDRGSRPSSELFTRLVQVPQDSHEDVKNHSLLEALLGRPTQKYRPKIKVTADLERQAEDVVSKLKLEPGRYVVGCPTGTVNVPNKSWPEEDYVNLLTHLHRKHRLPVLLTGLPEESSFLERIASGAQEQGISCKQWIGSPEDPVSLLGLIRHSCLYLGTDSGPMHLAAALNVPVVALFGGGTWPRFLPLARRSFVATQQVPCFGCDWDCWLDEPICIRKVPVQKFRDALDWILSPAEDERRVDRGEPPEKFSEEIIRRAIPQTKAVAQQLKKQLEASEADRAKRLEVIHQRDQRVAQLSQQWEAVNQRLDESETHRGEVARELEVSQAARTDLAQKLESSEADRAARLELIHSLQRQIAELATTKGALKRVAAAVTRRLRIYSFLKKHQQLCERIYDVLFRIVSRAKEVTPAREVIPVAPLDSPQVEAFIVAPAEEGELDWQGQVQASAAYESAGLVAINHLQQELNAAQNELMQARNELHKLKEKLQQV